MLAIAALGTATFFSSRVAAPQFIQTIHQSSEYRPTPSARRPAV
jgi:hypothetical protein